MILHIKCSVYISLFIVTSITSTLVVKRQNSNELIWHRLSISRQKWNCSRISTRTPSKGSKTRTGVHTSTAYLIVNQDQRCILGSQQPKRLWFISPMGLCRSIHRFSQNRNNMLNTINMLSDQLFGSFQIDIGLTRWHSDFCYSKSIVKNVVFCKRRFDRSSAEYRIKTEIRHGKGELLARPFEKDERHSPEINLTFSTQLFNFFVEKFSLDFFCRL